LNRDYIGPVHSGLSFYHDPFSLSIPNILCQNFHMRNLTATLCLTIAVLLGSAGNAFSEGEWFPTDKPNCDIWNPGSQPNETARWSGDCLNGKAHGYGRTTWQFLKNKKLVEGTTDGEMRNGK
jgi:hypothetical protein